MDKYQKTTVPAPLKMMPEPLILLVGAVGIEPTTPSASRKCSPPELCTRV